MLLFGYSRGYVSASSGEVGLFSELKALFCIILGIEIPDTADAGV
jgi:hypothetical protein